MLSLQSSGTTTRKAETASALRRKGTLPEASQRTVHKQQTQEHSNTAEYFYQQLSQPMTLSTENSVATPLECWTKIIRERLPQALRLESSELDCSGAFRCLPGHWLIATGKQLPSKILPFTGDHLKRLDWTDACWSICMVGFIDGSVRCLHGGIGVLLRHLVLNWNESHWESIPLDYSQLVSTLDVEWSSNNLDVF